MEIVFSIFVIIVMSAIIASLRKKQPSRAAPFLSQVGVIMKKLPFAVIGLAVLLGCVTYNYSYRYEPQPSDVVEAVALNDGYAVARYSDDNVEMTIEQKGNTEIVVAVRNNTDREFLVRETDFVFENSADNVNWTAMKTYTAEKYIAYKKREAATLAVLGAVGAGLSVAAQPTPYYSPSQRGIAQEMDRQRVNRSVDNVNKEYERAYGDIRDLSSVLFSDERILPGGIGGGAIHAIAMGSSYTYGKYYRITCNCPDIPAVSFVFAKNAYTPAPQS